jgi:hypothetical protein
LTHCQEVRLATEFIKIEVKNPGFHIIGPFVVAVNGKWDVFDLSTKRVKSVAAPVLWDIRIMARTKVVINWIE